MIRRFGGKGKSRHSCPILTALSKGAYNPLAMSSQEPLLRIHPEFLTDAALDRYIYPVMTRTYYWTDRWEGGIYVALARAGFISVCSEFPESGCLLLPQIHDRCAVLDWADRKASKSTLAALRPERLARERVRLRITQKIEPVLDALSECWGETSWFLPPYKALMRDLASGGIAGGASPGSSLNLFAVELLAGNGERPVAGELGYVIGSTWTSLSGFMHPDRARWNNMGKVQLHALATLLERTGFSFWNLGQPQMQYKLDLGARILGRDEFLARWIPARDDEPPAGFLALADREIDCAGLLGDGRAGIL